MSDIKAALQELLDDAESGGLAESPETTATALKPASPLRWVALALFAIVVFTVGFAGFFVIGFFSAIAGEVTMFRFCNSVCRDADADSKIFCLGSDTFAKVRSFVKICLPEKTPA